MPRRDPFPHIAARVSRAEHVRLTQICRERQIGLADLVRSGLIAITPPGTVEPRSPDRTRTIPVYRSPYAPHTAKPYAGKEQAQRPWELASQKPTSGDGSASPNEKPNGDIARFRDKPVSR
jgi:hypothetical protein